MLCRYCQNLNYAQQLLQPVDPNKYTDYNCVLPVSRCLDILIAEALIYFVAAIYFDNVFADENGVRRKPWCALVPLSRGSHLLGHARALCTLSMSDVKQLTWVGARPQKKS